MIDFTTTDCLLFPEIFAKPAVVQFDQKQGSSDGGAMLLKAAEGRYGLIGSLAECLEDKRQVGKVDHTLRELLAQRMFSIACGYADANDSARLASDPVHKILLDRDPVTGFDLASQPTLLRFEDSVDRKQLYRMGEALAGSLIERHARRLRGHARRVTIDLDPTDDPMHGAQQLSFFNTHYDSWCYLPVMGFSFNDEAEQYLCAAVLRPGNVTALVGKAGIFCRLLIMVRYFSRTLPSAFASMATLRIPAARLFGCRARRHYVVAMAKNAVLQHQAEEVMQYARTLSGVTGETGHIYTCRFAIYAITKAAVRIRWAQLQGKRNARQRMDGRRRPPLRLQTSQAGVAANSRVF